MTRLQNNHRYLLPLTRLFAILLLLSLTLCAQAQETTQGIRGRASGNGLIFGRRTLLTVWSNITGSDDFYYGFVDIRGRLAGKIWIIPTVGVTDPTFSSSNDLITGDDIYTATASGDLTLNAQPAMLTFTWTRDVQDGSQSTIAWVIRAYEDFDFPGLPTGDILFGSGQDQDGSPISLSAGQVWVRLPQDD